MRTWYRAYWALERRIVPNHRSSQFAYYEALDPLLATGTRWLDTGCGHQVFPDWMAREERSVLSKGAHLTGIDLDKQGLRRHPGMRDKVFGDLGSLPFGSGSFDVVSANMVVEHLEDPLRVLEEMRRVLVDGGRIVIHTVNRYHWAIVLARLLPDGAKRWLIARLENRPGEDVFRTHYRLNSEADITRVAAAARLQVESLIATSGSAALAALGVVALPELIWIRLLRARSLRRLRSNLVIVLRKPAEAAVQGHQAARPREERT